MTRTLLALTLLAPVAGCVPAGATTIEIAIRYSRFTPTVVEVPRGRPVTIVLRNDDPIDHEWIVGTEDLHARHRNGTEPSHDTLPTEVSIPALTTRTTSLTFAERGALAFVCHLPGHEAYGMRGAVQVR